MCGIIGYVGGNAAADILLDGLKNLEYRGYDSAGIALNENKKIDVIKSSGKIINLFNKVHNSLNTLNDANVGIGHIRWATHGKANEENAHPHLSDNGKLVLVHNGIIENYKELKEELEKEGFVFVSETDTEVAVHLIARELHRIGNLEQAVVSAVKQLKGAFAFCIMHKDYPDEIIAVRKNAPLVIGLGNGENFVASDVPAIIGKAQKMIYLDDNEMALIRKDKVIVKNLNGLIVCKKAEPLNFEAMAISKRGYKHFMLKEINEQPDIVRHNLQAHLKDSNSSVVFDNINLNELAAKVKKIEIVACGTSLHAAMVAKYVMEEWLHLPVSIEAASEYIYHYNTTDEDTLVIGISQSGETIDTITALKRAKEHNATTLVITNRPDSSIVRTSDLVVPLNAGIEVSVAATKSYTAQLMSLYLLALGLAEAKGTLDNEKLVQIKTELKTLPAKMEEILSNSSSIKECAQKYYNKKSLIYIARGINTATAFEGALKLKEISYVNANAYIAGELKHGPIALLDENMPVVAVLIPGGQSYAKTLSNCEEAKARNAKMIAVSSAPRQELESVFDDVISIPSVSEDLSPILTALPMQMFAYYVSDLLGREIDQPRNLAKSVTVE